MAGIGAAARVSGPQGHGAAGALRERIRAATVRAEPDAVEELMGKLAASRAARGCQGAGHALGRGCACGQASAAASRFGARAVPARQRAGQGAHESRRGAPAHARPEASRSAHLGAARRYPQRRSHGQRRSVAADGLCAFGHGEPAVAGCGSGALRTLLARFCHEAVSSRRWCARLCVAPCRCWVTRSSSARPSSRRSSAARTTPTCRCARSTFWAKVLAPTRMRSVTPIRTRRRSMLSARSREGSVHTRSSISVKLSALEPRYTLLQSARVSERLVPRMLDLARRRRQSGYRSHHRCRRGGSTRSLARYHRRARA